MALQDIKIYSPLDSEFTFTPAVASGVASSINAGEPTKAGTGGNVAIMVDGDGTTSQRFAGVAKSTSTDTVAAAGSVIVWIPLPGIIYQGKAKTTSLANTQALITALFYKRVVFDLTASVWTVDTAASDAATNGLVIVGGEYQTSTIYFTVQNGVTILGNVAN